MKKYSALTGADAPSVFYSLPELHYPKALNAVQMLLESAMENGWHSRPAYFHRGRMISYGELRHEVHRYAGALRLLGVEAGDTVLLRVEDGPELVYALLAIQVIGAIAVPTYAQLRSDGLVTRVIDSGAKVAFVSNTLREAFESVPPQCGKLEQVVIVSEDATGRFTSLRDILPAGDSQICTRRRIVMTLR